MKEINDLDELTTKGMLALEGKIRKIQNHYPWSPILKKIYVGSKLVDVCYL